MNWRKSTYSGEGNCVIVADDANRVLVRDTKDQGAGPVLAFSPDAWRRFAGRLKADVSLAPSSAVLQNGSPPVVRWSPVLHV